MKKSPFSMRLAELRQNKGISQGELGIVLAEFSGREKPFSISAVSAWEQGIKVPSFASIVAISEYFDVSVEYLRGLTNSKASMTNNVYDYIEKKFLIRKEELPIYNSCPVWLEFNEENMQNQWGIVDDELQLITCVRGRIPFSTLNATVYAIPMPNDIFTETFLLKPLTWKKISELNSFWIEIVSSDKKIKAEYNGWYRHNENKTCIINSLGLTLPYAGYGISWRAYSESFRNE